MVVEMDRIFVLASPNTEMHNQDDDVDQVSNQPMFQVMAAHYLPMLLSFIGSS